MSTCERRLFNDADGMRCSEPAGHEPSAHVYRSAWAADTRHDDEPEGDHR